MEENPELLTVQEKLQTLERSMSMRRERSFNPNRKKTSLTPPPVAPKVRTKSSPVESLTSNENISGRIEFNEDQNIFLFNKLKEETNILLIGKTGNGKSCLGNTILGRESFKSKSSLQSVTRSVTYDVSEVNGQLVKVVDGPGVGDTRMDTVDATEELLDAMSEAITICPEGFHAFLLVVKFGGRFTAEDKETVEMLKKIFGKKFFRKFFIIVMTCGDKFEEEVKTDFTMWVEKQKNGIFGELYDECNKRILLFDNRTKDTAKTKKQLFDLLSMINQMKKQNCRYSNEHFDAALLTRNTLMLEVGKELIEKEIMKEADLIYKELNEILKKGQTTYITSMLRELKKKPYALYFRIKEKDKDTNVLESMLNHVASLYYSIQVEEQLSEKMKEVIEDCNNKIRQEAEFHAKELQKQREAYEKILKERKEHGQVKLKDENVSNSVYKKLKQKLTSKE